MSERFECDHCGACCSGKLIVEANALDALREPKILTADCSGRAVTLDELLEDEFRAVILACGSNRPCSFLGADKLCSIYPTRPNDCVAMQAGDEQCQDSRARSGLPPLKPILQEQAQ